MGFESLELCEWVGIRIAWVGFLQSIGKFEVILLGFRLELFGFWCGLGLCG